MKKENVWLITAKTNLHVGDENSQSYGIIDKSIQRDALTDLPCINSSSLKGAINEYCCNSEEGKQAINSDNRICIFGSDKTDKNKDSSKGRYVFFDAQILFLPVPDDNTLYKLVTTKDILERFREQTELFGLSLSADLMESIKNVLKINVPVEIKSTCDFKALCSDDCLPIIARNCIDDVQNPKLWYEQILPRETVLYTMIDPQHEETDKLEVLNGKIVQIGANATIGYGYCKFIHL